MADCNDHERSWRTIDFLVKYIFMFLEPNTVEQYLDMCQLGIIDLRCAVLLVIIVS